MINVTNYDGKIVYDKDEHNRSFLKSWFQLFDWLGYDRALNRAYCLPCIKHSSNSKTTAFTRIGYNDWSHAMYAFKKHEKTKIHVDCNIAWRIKKSTVAPVSMLIQQGHKKDVLENRANLTKLIEVILLAANQCIALRGHDESSTSQNKGNFK